MENNKWISDGLPEVSPGTDPLGRPMSRKVLVKYEIHDKIDYTIDQVYYQVGKEPYWFKRLRNVIAWMDIPS